MNTSERGMIAPWKGAKFLKPPCRRSWVIALSSVRSRLVRGGRVLLGFLESVLESPNLKRAIGPGLKAQERFEFEPLEARLWFEQTKYR